MEILQTIWTALTTENEVLISILSIPFTLLEVAITTLLFTSIFNLTVNRKTKICYILVFSLFSILSSYCIPNPYNTFVNVLICPILIALFFKAKLFTSILAEIVPYVIFVLIGSLVHNLYILLFGISTELIVNVPIYRIASSLCVYIIVYIIYLILKHYNINIHLLDTFKSVNNSTLLLNFIFGILAIVVQSYIAFSYNNVLPFYVIIINVFTLLFYFIFSLYSLIRTNKLEITERDLEQSKQYIKTLTILHDNIRCFKHDFGNMVTTIGRLCAVKQHGWIKNLLFSTSRRLSKS